MILPIKTKQSLWQLMAPVEVEHPLPVNLVEGDESDFATYKNYKTCPAILKKAESILLTIDGTIFHNYRLIKETLADQKQYLYYQYRYLLKHLTKSKKTTLPATERYLLVTDAYASGHFHWFCEVLPKLAALSNVEQYTLLLPKNSYVQGMGNFSLKILNNNFKNIIFLEEGVLYKVPQIFYVNAVSGSGLNPVLLQRVHSGIAGKNNEAGKAVYISRKAAAFRKVKNENDLLPLLKKYNIDFVQAEELNPAQQYQLFSKTTTLIGIHGAGLTNCFFMPAGSKVVELRKKENNTSNVGYWHLACSLQHQYYYFNGIADGEGPLVGRGCNLTINPEKFEEKILKKLF